MCNNTSKKKKKKEMLNRPFYDDERDLLIRLYIPNSRLKKYKIVLPIHYLAFPYLTLPCLTLHYKTQLILFYPFLPVNMVQYPIL